MKQISEFLRILHAHAVVMEWHFVLLSRVAMLRRCSTPSVYLLSLPCFALTSPGQPNFVFILGEGHGWSSTSVQMDDAVPQSKSSFVRTPNLERLAREGMRFADFYAPSPRCTPSRAALFTGKSPAQLHMTFVNEGKRDGDIPANSRVIPASACMELPEKEVTIAELLKHHGYATAHFGKWHMGRADPTVHGFDESDGPNSNGGPDNVENPHPKQLFRLTELGIDFIVRQAKAKKPFYLQLSHYASRNGGDARPESIAAVKSWGGNLGERELATAAADYDLDAAFRMVLKKLDELGIAKDTYVIFTTDHGTPGKNPPFAGGKGTVSDGGLRVPFLMRGPGIQPGTCSHVRALGVDLMPTVAGLARITEPMPAGIEGGSLLPVLATGDAGKVNRSREEYVVHFPHYDKDPLGPASTILLGDFKLIHVYETGARELYDIAKDPGERQDLAQRMPDKAKHLDKRLGDYLAAVKAQMPVPKGVEDQPRQDSVCLDVPAHPFDIVLGRASRDSVTLSILAYDDLDGYIAFGTAHGRFSRQTNVQRFKKGEPVEIRLDSLQRDTAYFYEFRTRNAGKLQGTFHTQRPPGSNFTFTITADSHLDDRTSPEVYRTTLGHALGGKPDFHVDLGDTFMTEKHENRENAFRQYLAQRFYFGPLCSSAPLYLALGNHDGESPRGQGNEEDDLAVWSNQMRKRYFPNPVPSNFYAGNEKKHPQAGLLQDYYAWEWGDGLFIVLDPFWYTQKQRGQKDNWRHTLGEDQYRWLEHVLSVSRAGWKFVFIHHLVGGADEQCRGGSEAVPFSEWGGKNLDGTDGFPQHRPGWTAPVHELLKRHGVSVVFHGHDHLYARQQVDGIIYQEVPQPGNPGSSRLPRYAEEYGYRNGTILGGSGHLRVSVSPTKVLTEYIAGTIRRGESGDHKSPSTIADSYTVGKP